MCAPRRPFETQYFLYQFSSSNSLIFFNRRRICLAYFTLLSHIRLWVRRIWGVRVCTANFAIHKFFHINKTRPNRQTFLLSSFLFRIFFVAWFVAVIYSFALFAIAFLHPHFVRFFLQWFVVCRLLAMSRYFCGKIRWMRVESFFI